jgi:hypothetical protein
VNGGFKKKENKVRTETTTYAIIAEAATSGGYDIK